MNYDHWKMNDADAEAAAEREARIEEMREEQEMETHNNPRRQISCTPTLFVYTTSRQRIKRHPMEE